MSDISISSCASDEPPPLVEGDVDCDDEQEREKIQILVDIRARLLTGHHTAGITHNRRCNVNKQIVSYNVVDGVCTMSKKVSREKCCSTLNVKGQCFPRRTLDILDATQRWPTYLRHICGVTSSRKCHRFSTTVQNAERHRS